MCQCDFLSYLLQMKRPVRSTVGTELPGASSEDVLQGLVVQTAPAVYSARVAVAHELTTSFVVS